MTLGADHAQTASSLDLELLLIGDSNRTIAGRFVLFRSGLFALFKLFYQEFLCEHVWIAAEQDVRTTTSHVRCDRDRTLAACLRNDRSFTLVILRVQHLMLDTTL